MRKLILAIIAIICVDIGFVVYKSADDRADVASKDVNVRDQGTRFAADSPPNDLTESSRTADDLTTESPNADTSGVTPEKSEPARASHPRTKKIGRSMIERQSYTAKLHLRGIKKGRTLPTRVDLPNITIFYAARKPSEFRVDKELAGEGLMGRRSDLSSQPLKTPPRSEDRSLIARALPIIKKPYDWIKAIASRLY
jgi:hypothetical protein